MSPIVVFFLGAYIGACAGAVLVLLWWYRVDGKRDHRERRWSR